MMRPAVRRFHEERNGALTGKEAIATFLKQKGACHVQ